MRRTVHTDLTSLGHDEDFAPKPASEPTPHEPGSVAKIEVMRLRVERGECLWHPQDCDLPSEPTGRPEVPVSGLRVILQLGRRDEKEKPV